MGQRKFWMRGTRCRICSFLLQVENTPSWRSSPFVHELETPPGCRSPAPLGPPAPLPHKTSQRVGGRGLTRSSNGRVLTSPSPLPTFQRRHVFFRLCDLAPPRSCSLRHLSPPTCGKLLCHLRKESLQSRTRSLHLPGEPIAINHRGWSGCRF